MEYHLGIDVGSVALKIVVVGPDRRIRYSDYRRIHGQPKVALKAALANLDAALDIAGIVGVVSTGAGGLLAQSLIGGDIANEVVALSKACAVLTPQARTLVEMGGADSKFLCFNSTNGVPTLADFAMNSLCAAGTGSFLDQQANRLKVSIENEFGDLALKSKNPPRIAGRCSVFAKSDMIHLQQIATPDYDIVSGLCHAVARNFKSAIARGKKIVKPIAFAGGVASNAGMVSAFEHILELGSGELIVPEEHGIFCACGAAYIAMESKTNTNHSLQLDEDSLTQIEETSIRRRDRLVFAFPDSKHYNQTLILKRGPELAQEGYLGIDVGSLSTNLVVLDRQRKVLARRYLMTEGRPIEAIRRGLAEIGEELGNSVRIIGCGTTGSGRYLTGDFVGADIIKNEITAQAKAAILIDPEVDTIFEIGGQDSKYISIEHGVVVDFEMNKACAAGTGSFLQEQAEKLGIEIDREFGERALRAACPVGCGERCTVFMESDLSAYQQSGIDKDDLIAGLAYSIAQNYLTKVVQKRKIGKRIFFQGGVAWNKGVVAAFEKILGQTIIVPPHHDVTGAIGAALIAMERPAPHQSKFKGFDLSKRSYTLSSFVCEDCSNMCEIRKVEVENERPLYYGSRCEKYDAETHKSSEERFDFFKFREKLLYSSIAPRRSADRTKTIGLPRMLFFYELYPFWGSFFRNLGYQTVLSAPSDQKILSFSLENCPAESCFPIKLAIGHVQNLLDKNIDYIFLPSIINLRENGAPHENSFFCPYVQSIPYMVKANLSLGTGKSEFISVSMSLKMDPDMLYNELRPLKAKFQWSDLEFREAINAGIEHQKRFFEALMAKGQESLNKRDSSKPAICIISRPYNACDPKLSLEIPRKLLDLGVEVIHLEALPLGEKYLELTDANMYWRSGQKILAAAEIIRDIPNLYPVYISNFGCGPDSFITHFFEKHLGGKPYLQIEIDEHSADGGILTRLEAFLDSLERKCQQTIYRRKVHPDRFPQNGKPRKIYIPYMSDHAVTIAAAIRACGVPAEALPESDDASLEYGKRHTSGKECFPCQVTTGDILRELDSPGFEREHSAFFMPSASGPCRFGQYHLFHRQLLDDLGYADVPLITPNSRTAYQDLSLGDQDFQKIAWRGMVATDLLYKLYHHYRPYQNDKTQIDELYRRYLLKLADHVEKRRELRPFFEAALADFKVFAPAPDMKLPIIGVVGEIFLRANRYSNNFLVEHLENLGAEVWLAPMAEWIFYTNFTYRRRLKHERRRIELFTASLTNAWQHQEEKRLARVLASDLPTAIDPPVEELITLAQPYIDVSLSGEAILSIGKAIEYRQHGAGGIVNTLPFNCMPGTIVAAISRRVSDDLGGFPWINLAYEGLSDKGDELRLEAFVHQVRQFDYSR